MAEIRKRFDEQTYRGKSLIGGVPSKDKVKDPLGIDAYDHVEMWVGNAKQATYYYSLVYGFQPLAYRGPETGFAETATFVLKQNNIYLALTSPPKMTHPIAANVLRHGDTVHDVALQVSNCEAFYYEAMRRGAQSALIPTVFEDGDGTVKRAAIHTYGDVIHSIVERKSYHGLFWPGFIPYSDLFPAIPQGDPVGLQYIDHIVGNVELGKMDSWVKFYEDVLGFKQMQHFSDNEISTEYSALMSKVMTNGSGKVKFPLNEPAQGKRKSQIEEYLEFHYGPGVQHIAMRTDDILKTIPELRKRGAGFLRVPRTYYDALPDRVGKIKEDLAKIAEYGVLVDRDDDGYLLQLFTKSVSDRPTLFFEVIQREGSQGFGVGNFKALFEALEVEQELRGNL